MSGLNPGALPSTLNLSDVRNIADIGIDPNRTQSSDTSATIPEDNQNCAENAIRVLDDLNWSKTGLNPIAKSFILTNPHKSDALNPHAKSFVPNPSKAISSDKDSSYTILQNLRLKNVDKIIIGHININSIRNKIHLLADLIRGKVDIMLISETKLDSSFPKPQFFLQGYSEPLRLDRTSDGGGLLLYLRDDIPTKPLPLINENIECIISELIMSKKKRLLFGTYNPCKSLIVKHLSTLEISLCHPV